MGLFERRRKRKVENTCANCQNHVYNSGTDFCVRGASPELNIRMLSLQAMERQFDHCPSDMKICDDFIPRQ